MFTEDGVFEDYTLGFRMEGKEQLTGLFQGFFDPAQWTHDFTALSYKGDDTGGAIEYTWVMNTKEFMGVPTNGQPLNIQRNLCQSHYVMEKSPAWLTTGMQLSYYVNLVQLSKLAKGFSCTGEPYLFHL